MAHMRIEPLDSTTLKLRDRLAVRQARMVLSYAFLIGLFLSFTQIASDYFSQKNELKGTLEQLTESIHQSAVNSVWTLSVELAQGVAEGLIGYEAILEARIYEADSIFLEKSRPRPDNNGWLIRSIFGEPYIKSFTLYPPEGEGNPVRPIGRVEMLVDPSFAGQNFLNRALLIVGSGVARTVLLAAALLVLFYFTLTRPVIAVSKFVQSYDPKRQSRSPLNIERKALHGELGSLLGDVETLMNSVDVLNTDLEAKVQARTAQLQLAEQSVEATSAGILSIDQHQRILYANQSLTKALLAHTQQSWHDTAPDNLIGQHFSSLLHDKERQSIEQALSQNSACRVDIALCERLYNVLITPALDPNTQVCIGYTLAWHDHTEEKRSQEVVRDTISAASAGKLEQRIELRTENPYYAALYHEINQLLDTNERIINEANHVLASVADGNLKQSMAEHYEGAFAQLAQSINLTIGQLSNIIQHINDTVKTVDGGSRTLAQTNNTLSLYNEKLTDHLGHALSNVNALRESVEDNLSSISTASTLAEQATNNALQGKAASTEFFHAITDLSQTSQRISSITETINGISFQTNLLALNAAVEAARAGDTGKGFAVVASEVQSLSQRSTVAASEISALLNESAAKVAACCQLIDASTQTQHKVVDSVMQVASLVHDVSHVSEAQSHKIRNIDEIMKALKGSSNDISDVVKNAEKHSQEMEDHAKHLANLMDFFASPPSSGARHA